MAFLHCDCLKGAVRLFIAWQILHKIAVIFCFVCNKTVILLFSETAKRVFQDSRKKLSMLEAEMRKMKYEILLEFGREYSRRLERDIGLHARHLVR